MLKIKTDNFDLDNTITCGQIFRYVKENNNSYTIILNDRVVNIKKDNNELLIISSDYNNLENVIKDFFDLDRDYLSIQKEIINISGDMENIINNSKGLKVIHSFPLETIISFIISANNSVNNITNSVNLISEKYGTKINFNNKEYYLFPEINQLTNVTEIELRDLKIGFRAPYIIELIEKINALKINLNIIDDLSTLDALDYLMTLNGVGPKVASCILLFAYKRFDVFPIDTWVKKYMEENYNIKGLKNIIEYSKNNFKEYSGLILQYMFNSKRNL